MPLAVLIQYGSLSWDIDLQTDAHDGDVNQYRTLHYIRMRTRDKQINEHC